MKDSSSPRKDNMFERLRLMLERYEQLTNLLADPEVISDQNKWREYAKEHASMEEAITLYKEYLTNQKNLSNIKTEPKPSRVNVFSGINKEKTKKNKALKKSI